MPVDTKLYFGVLDVQYSYLDDGYTIVATTDVPCHLYLRMTDKPPLRHVLPSIRRGLMVTGDIRFCFTVLFRWYSHRRDFTLRKRNLPFPLSRPASGAAPTHREVLFLPGQ